DRGPQLFRGSGSRLNPCRARCHGVAFGRVQGRSTGQTGGQEQRSCWAPRAIASRSAPSDSAKPRSSAPLCRRQSTAAHSRIVAQALGVVHILVSGKATKYRLSEQPGQWVPTILATACVGQNITRHLGQTEYVVEFAISQ